MPLCHYILLAEFDIDEGSVLRHEYPVPTGCDGHLLAELMLPDGAHLRTEDWTVFYLNQTKATTTVTFNDAANSDSSQEELGSSNASSTGPSATPKQELLHVMSLVRTKHGAAYKRGALVKALAVCSPLPYIQIFKPVLLLALEDYFNEPTPSVLKRLYDSINAIDLSLSPNLSINERLILRQSERKDLFEEKFGWPEDAPLSAISDDANSLVTRRSATPTASAQGNGDEHASQENDALAAETKSKLHLNIPSGSNFAPRTRVASDTSAHSIASSISQNGSTFTALGMQRQGSATSTLTARSRSLRDTHFYEASVSYNSLTLPIRIPLGTFASEVGDYSLITLIQTFSNFTGTLGPLHPHLHTNGSLTPPMIVLYNALLTYKRVLFLGGAGSPAGHVSNFVLSACALGSGCGLFFGSTIKERAFPYSNLTNLDNVLEVKGYIAGVSNPRFEDLTNTWDVLCNIESGRITISKDIQQGNTLPSSFPTSSNASSVSVSSSSTQQESLSHAEQYSQSPEPASAISGIIPFGQHGQGIQSLSSSQNGEAGSQLHSDVSHGKVRIEGRLDSSENTFMDEISLAIQSHYGEAVIRGRFIDYTRRFVRLASRWEEETYGVSSIDHPSQAYNSSGRLGSGLVFPGLSAEEIKRELAANAGRIEGWRRTKSYDVYKEQWAANHQIEGRAIRGFDLQHQISRLRFGKKMSSEEVEAIYWKLRDSIQTDEQVIELLAHLPSHLGGLLPLAFGLFQPSALARESTIVFLNTLSAHPTGAKFLSNLNAFHRLAYTRLNRERAEARGSHKRQASGNMNVSGWDSREPASIPTSA